MLQEILFKPMPLPMATSVRRHYCDGVPENSKYGLSDKMLASIRAEADAKSRKFRLFRGEVVGYIEKHPRCTCSEISKDLGRSMKRVADLLLDLVDDGTLGRESIHTLKRGGPPTNFYWVAE